MFIRIHVSIVVSSNSIIKRIKIIIIIFILMLVVKLVSDTYENGEPFDVYDWTKNEN